MLVRVLATSTAIATIGIAAAAPPPEDLLTEAQYYDDMPEVLTATRLRQPALDSPSSITVIDREEILASGARDVAELMRLVPGFQVEYFSAHKPVVTYHGLADDFARRLQVLVDGRSVYTPSFGGVLWSALPLSVDDIARVEVIRSPNAASYGPNSFSAIINIITLHPATEGGSEASATLGQRGQSDAFARATGRAGAGHYRLSYERQEDDGFADETRPDGREIDRLAGRYDRGGGTDELMLKAGMESASVEHGRTKADPSDGDANIPRERDLRAVYGHAQWTRHLDTDSRLSLQYYGNYDRWLDTTRFGPHNDFDLPGLTNPRVKIDLNVRAERHDLEAVYTARPAAPLRIVVGAGARHESVESRWVFGTHEPQTNELLRAFGHAEYRVRPRTTLHLGALVEDNELVGTTSSPRLALVQETAPYHRLRLSVAYATRTPTLFEQRQERYFDVHNDTTADPVRVYTAYTADDDLEPERVRATEIGYRIEPPGRRWGMDVKLFRERISDLIVREPTGIPASAPPNSQPNGTITGFTNGLSGRLEGVEGELSLYPGRDLDLRLWASRASLERVRADNDDRREEYTASLPHTTAGLLAMYRLSATRSLSLDYYYIDSMSWVDKSDTTRTERLDAQYREEWPHVSPSAFLAVRLDSILGEYVEYDDDNIVDTRLSVRMGLRF